MEQSPQYFRHYKIEIKCSAVDPEKREVYDEFGEQGIKEGGRGGGGGFTSPMDMFNMFFGGGGGPGGGGSAGGKLKSKPIVHKLTVSLEELFNGKVRVCVNFPFSVQTI